MTGERLPRRTGKDLQLRAIREILRATVEALPLDEILSVIANMAIIVFDASTSWLMVKEDARLRTVVSRGELADALTGRECAVGRGSAGAAATRESPTILEPGDVDPADVVIGGLAGNAKPVVLLPLRAGDRSLGLLGCVVPPDATRDVSFLLILAEQAATAVETAELREESRTWRQRLDAVFEQMSELVLVFDREGRLALMNSSAAQVLGQTGLHLGDSIADLVTKAGLYSADGRQLSPEETAIARALRGERVESAEERLQRPGGMTRYFLVSGVPLFTDRRMEGAVVVWRDISELRRAEQFRDEYLSLVSHDLRSPLTTVMGMGDWLRRMLERKGLKKEASSAQAIVTSAQRMNAMIQDLVDTVRLESGYIEMHKQPTDLVQLVSDLVGRVGTVQDRARIKVEAPEPLTQVPVDPDRIERAIVNLLTNALKYSAPDTPVVIRLARRNGDAIISVTDQGIGIPPEDLPHLFERFYSPRAGLKAEGLGLGLYITRLIVEAHGGRVWAESQVGKGSTFYIALPIA